MLHLPDELVGQVLTNLSPQDILSFSETCRHAREIALSEYIWKYKLIEGFAHCGGLPVSGEFYIEYMHRHNWSTTTLQHLDKLALQCITKNATDDVLSEELIEELTHDPRALNNVICTLLHVKHDDNRFTNLTRRYYGNYLLCALRHTKLLLDVKELFSQTPPNMLFAGAVISSKWQAAIKGEDIDCAPLEAILEALTHSVKKNMSLYAAHIPVTAELILDCVNTALYTEYGLSGNSENYDCPDNSRIDKVLLDKKGLPITLCIIYQEVARLSGVQLHCVNFPRHFLLSYTNADGMVTYIDSFNQGQRMTRQDCLSLCPMMRIPDVDRYFVVPTVQEVLARIVRNVQIRTHGLHEYSYGYSARFTLFRLLRAFGSLDRSNAREFADLCSIQGVNLAEAGRYLEETHDQTAEEDQGVIEAWRARLRKRRVEREEGVKTHPEGVKYHVGSVMHHNRYHYHCVIFGWSETCQMDPQWQRQMGVDALPGGAGQPFYKVLVEDGSERNAAQESLEPAHPITIDHEDIGKYFTKFDGERYIPNAALKYYYPEN